MPRLQLVPAPESLAQEPKITDRRILLIDAQVTLQMFLEAGESDGRCPLQLLGDLLKVQARVNQCVERLQSGQRPVLVKGGRA